MENTERNEFELTWQERFAQAEQAPSQEVWMGVERNLTIAEGGLMKRKVIFYQRVAAAAIFMALTLGGIITYTVLDQNPADQLVTQNSMEQTPSGTPEQPPADEIRPDGNVTGNPIPKAITPQNEGNSVAIVDQPENKHVNLNSRDEASKFIPRDIAFIGLADIYVGVPAEVHSSPRKIALVRKPVVEETRAQKKDYNEKVWAALGAAAGNYTPQLTGGNYAMQATASGGLSSGSQGSSNASGKGDAYSFGFNMGTRLSERWVLQGGLAYMNQAIDYTSSLASVSGSNKLYATVADYSAQSRNSFTVTNPYELNSVNEYVSVPVQAGYLLLNRKAGIQINSGLATDIFLRNTLTDTSGQLDSFSESAGESSPYRTFSWSALMGTEFSYKVGNHYRVALVPGLRYSLSPVVKSEASGNPLVWDLGFRFRYIFK